MAANRISYCLNLTGPSVAMDTACSSALTAVHAACEHIWSGRGEVALAGGVTIMINPGGSLASPRRQCCHLMVAAKRLTPPPTVLCVGKGLAWSC
nr:beta-ketoacyl synthase N-terminal-like domain-containing protein [Verrucomicrobium spinosum]